MIILMKEQKVIMAFLIAIAILLAFVVAFRPIPALAKGVGDTIGAPTKDIVVGTTHADMADSSYIVPAHALATSIAPIQAFQPVASSSTDSQEMKLRALIKQLQALIAQLQALNGK